MNNKSKTNYIEKLTATIDLIQDIHGDDDNWKKDFGSLGTVETMLKQFIKGKITAKTLKELLTAKIDL